MIIITTFRFHIKRIKKLDNKKSSPKVPFSTIGELKKNGVWRLKVVSATGQEHPVPICFFKQALHFAFEDYIRQIFFLLLSSQKNFLYAS